MSKTEPKPKNSLGKMFCNKIRGLDIYGKAIVLTYEGDETFKTHCGGMISTLIFMLLAAYTALQLRVLILKNDTTVSKSTVFKELINSNEVHNVGERDFVFGMSLNDNSNEYLNDPTYFTYSLRQVTQAYITDSSGSTSIDRNKTDISTTTCGTTSFKNADPNNIQRIGIDNYICPASLDYTIAANFFAPVFHYIEIKVSRCNNATSSVTCQDSTTIENVMKDSKFSLPIDNTFFDFGNYDNPVNHFLDEQFFWDLAPGFRKKTDIYIRRNEAVLIDDLVQLGQENEVDFFQVVDFREQFELEDLVDDFEFLSVFIRLDPKSDVYERRVYSIGDLLGQMGGVYESLMIIGAMFVGIFSERLFISAILRKIYQIDQIREKEVIEQAKNKRNSKNKKNRVDPTDLNKSENVNTVDIITPKLAGVTKNSERTMQDQKENKNEIDLESRKPNSYIEMLKTYILSRTEFIYDNGDIMQYIFC